MEISSFITKLTDVFENEHDMNITQEASFKEIEGYSSIIALSIIALADEEYHVKLKGDDIRNATTVTELFNIIKSRV